MLTVECWCILDSLIDGPRSKRETYTDVSHLNPALGQPDFDEAVLALQENGLLQPDPPDGPGPPREWPVASDGRLRLTAAGVAEWERPDYEPYWRPAPLLGWMRADRIALGAALATVMLAFTALALWGLVDSTWSYGPDCRVSLAAELHPIQARLIGAGAPAAALHQLALAAQPNLFASRALELLIEADEALEPLSAVPAIQEARWQLLTAMNLADPQNCRP